MFKFLNTHKPPYPLFAGDPPSGEQDLVPQQSLRVQHAFHATYSSYARGVAILLNKSLAYKVIHVSLDPEGRYIILVLEIGAVKYAFVNVYVPPPFSLGILYAIQEKLAPLQLTRVVWARGL